MQSPSIQSNAPIPAQLYTIANGNTSTDPFITYYANRDPTIYDFNYPIKKRWVNFQNNIASPKEWILESFSNNTGQSLANWILLASGGSIAVETVFGDDGIANDVTPDPANNEIQLFGQTVANGANAKPVFFKKQSDHIEELDVQVSVAAASAIIGNAGLSSYLNTQFTVDPATGFVQLIGGVTPPLLGLHPDAFTTPGTDPVIPNGSGIIAITGAQIAAGTTTNVIRTDSLAANTMTVEIQRSQAVSTSTIGDNGVSHFDSKYFLVDANGFVSSTAIANTMGVQNIGIKLSAGVFSIVGANGQFLSTTNPGYVTLHSNTIVGGFVTYKLTFASLAASPNFHDNSSGSSTIAGNTFGFDNNVNWSNDVPFFLYAVSKSDDTAVKFMISRYPNASISPVAGKIAQTGLTTQGSFFTFDSTITAADYASTNCLSLGAIRMQKVATTANDWTVQSLVINDGIGQFYPGGLFSWPAGTFGAATGSYFTSNGGTAPIYSSQPVSYTLTMDNVVTVGYVFGNNSTPGAGAVTAQVVYPFVALGGGFYNSGYVDSTALTVGTAVASQKYFQLQYQSTAANAILQLGTIGANAFLFTGKAAILFS